MTWKTIFMEPTLTLAVISLTVLGIIIFIIYLIVRKYYHVKSLAKIGFYLAILAPILVAGVLFNNEYISDRQLRSEANNIVEKAIEMADESSSTDNILKQNEWGNFNARMPECENARMVAIAVATIF